MKTIIVDPIRTERPIAYLGLNVVTLFWRMISGGLSLAYLL